MNAYNYRHLSIFLGAVRYEQLQELLHFPKQWPVEYEHLVVNRCPGIIGAISVLHTFVGVIRLYFSVSRLPFLFRGSSMFASDSVRA